MTEIAENVDWLARGNFTCQKCGKTLKTAEGLRSHAINSHGPDYGGKIRSQIVSAQRRADEDAQAKKLVEEARIAARKVRAVTLTTEQVDEIVAEMENLISMMEPYYSQGDCDKRARDLIAKLTALADGNSLTKDTSNDE